jgi:GDP/UDP-N,N'-diacetylbacillosamine 2-epimerase (hydrolysing)
MVRKIAVVTGTRAEYGILKPLLKKIVESGNLELNLIVTGLHLMKKYGLTIKEIERNSFEIGDIVEMYSDNEDDITYYGKALAKGVAGFTSTLSKIKPDILVILGDRLEPLAATLAVATLRIPIAHIHGGDKTDSGHIDENVRHSITRFANLHFTATKEHTKRLIKMGEEPWRIFEVGALGLDSVINQQPIPKGTFAKKVGIRPDDKIIVCVFHPVHLEKEIAGKQMYEILDAIRGLGIQTVIIYPNNDAGSQDIIEEIEKCRSLPFIKIFPSLSHLEYISLLKYADVLIGNSSSGIIEAPSLKLPVVNIGSRNVGREHADNIIFVDAKREDIIKAIEIALYNGEFWERVKQCVNPYGDGKASERTVKVLSEIEIDMKLLQKKITY